ncbi:GNAT family N-acetyltransferase [Sporosarcina koreensis]|uniref:GNAT family N-acetyltransferase n=1 Tax=Bacillales TaxID=1385 RepID=UPI00075F2A2F|nr:GNAT family N-acetyltransferase [Sporosarcina koreensis]
MKWDIRKVTIDNKEEILSLRVAEEQRHFIETIEESLAEAEQWEEFRPVGLYVDDVPVGFAMYGYLGDGKGGGNVWIDRLMIDEKFQGKGFGRHFMELLMQKVLDEYGEQPMYLSVYPVNTDAIRLYEKLGFVFIGEYDTKGEQIMQKG